MRVETCGKCIHVWKTILVPWNIVEIIYNEIVSMLHKSFLWHLLLRETNVSKVQCPIFNDVWNVFTARKAWDYSHVSKSYVIFLFHSKTKNDFMLKNSWEWKDNQCQYWMKLPHPDWIGHNHVVTMDLGIPESLIRVIVTWSIHHIFWCCM
jgi:hypothetical protein